MGRSGAHLKFVLAWLGQSKVRVGGWHQGGLQRAEWVLLTVGCCAELLNKGDVIATHALGRITHRLNLEIGRPVRWPFSDVPNMYVRE